MGKYQSEMSLEERKIECDKILQYWPDKIPIIAEKVSHSKLPQIPKSKLLCPNSYRFSQFLACLRSKLSLGSRESLFVFVNSKIIKGDESLKSIYELNKSEDGFLYIEYFEQEYLG